MKTKLLSLVTSAIEEINEDLEDKVPLEKGLEATLYGERGSLNSINLVSLIAAIEEGIEDEFDITVSLSDSSALSQAKTPFKTVGSLLAYAENLIETAE